MISVEHHRRCAAFGFRKGQCNHRCAEIREAIDAFNGDDRNTHRAHPDGREHYHARFALMAEDCDYEITGFSGIEGRRL